jgi:hypothetical protein
MSIDLYEIVLVTAEHVMARKKSELPRVV